MCLGAPMQVTHIEDFSDFVLVHVGYTIQKTAPAEARSSWKLLDQVLAATKGDHDA